MSQFTLDTYPGRPKLLFIGIPYSTHAHSWIDLLESAPFNVRLFGFSDGLPPVNWRVRTYITSRDLPTGLNPDLRQCLYPTAEEQQEAQRLNQKFEIRRQESERRHPWLRIERLYTKGLVVNPQSEGLGRVLSALLLIGAFIPYRFFRKLLIPRSVQAGEERDGLGADTPQDIQRLTQPKAASAEEWLAQIIREWQPDLIQTLGLDPASVFYYKVRQQYQLENIGKWVLQLRGGSDLTLTRLDAQQVERMLPLFKACDQVISDNPTNPVYLREMGVEEKKFAPIIPVPGTGGIDVDAMAHQWEGNPSTRRIILWAKSYECPWSKALPVLEAIRKAWNQIKPCEIYMLTVNEETRMWFNTLPAEIREHCHVFQGIGRDEVFRLMAKSRVLLAPSLVDGVPNSLYEAMAAGAFPIVSPLDTITPVVENERNVLFARNLYPDEIAAALTRAMTDDRLVDEAAQCNLEKVRAIANRALIRPQVIDYYRLLVG